MSGWPGADVRESLRAAAEVTRATAERMEAILADQSLCEEEAIERVGADVEVFCAAMETLNRELRRPDEG